MQASPCDVAGRAGGNFMKAVFIDRFGGPEVLTYGDQPDPLAEPGQVVVDVVAASVNGADWRVRAGQLPRQARLSGALANAHLAATHQTFKGRNMSKALDGYAVLITGGSTGLGLSHARVLG